MSKVDGHNGFFCLSLIFLACTVGNSTREEERFTPTPRRSIHSYKVTEISKETMVKTPDGIVTRDIEYSKSTSDSLDTAKTFRQRVLYWSPRVILGFIVACVVFYGYQVKVLFLN